MEMVNSNCESDIIYLSVCIPTYNRGDALAQVLESLAHDDFFESGNGFEIVVSDNASTDNTKEVCEAFARKYPKQFVYHRRDVNGGTEVNEMTLLSIARGQYIKFQNDCYVFKHGGLKRLFAVVEKNLAEKPLLCFGNAAVTGLDERIYEAYSHDRFLQLFSYWTTWIGGYGLWREDIDETLPIHKKYVSSMLPQVAVTWSIFEKKRKAIIDNECLFGDSVLLTRKGGYNFAKIFGLNYFSILKNFCGEGRISKAAFAVEQKRVYLGHIFPMYFDFLGKCNYEKGGFWRYTKEFHFKWYFWWSLLLWPGFKVVSLMPSSFRAMLVAARRKIKSAGKK